MKQNIVFNLERLRESCAQCSLQQLCLPAGIGRQSVEHLDQVVRHRRPLVRGQRLFRIGDKLEGLYVVRKGAFKTAVLSDHGEEQIIGFHLPGELLGLGALASGRHRCEAEALGPAGVCLLPLESLGEIAQSVPGLHAQFLRVIGRGISRDRDHLEILGRRQAPERLAMFLLGLSERLRELGENDNRFTLPMSREDIARYLGLVIETVSRGFTRLQDEGLIKVRGRRVEIIDPDRLLALAERGRPPEEPVCGVA